MPIADILLSPAKVYHAPTGTAAPNENTVAYGAAWGGGWIDVGYTTAPLSIKYSRDLFELEVEQITLPVKSQVNKESLQAETTLAEFTGANLKLAFGGTASTTAAGPAQAPKEELVSGGDPVLPVESWGFEGVYQTDAGAKYPVRVFIWRGSSVLNGSLEFSKKAAVGLPIQITAWADTSKAIGEQLWKVQKVTGTHT